MDNLNEVKFESVSEIVTFLLNLEKEIVDLESAKSQKLAIYKQISSQVMGAPTFGELTIPKLAQAIERIVRMELDKP